MRARSFALLPVLSLACAGDVALETSGWGIGDVVDCDPSGERCWPEADRASLTSAVRDLGGVMAMAPDSRRDVLRGVLEGLRQVEHKMTAGEIEALGEIEAALAETTGALPDEVTAATAAEIRRRVLHRLENAMIAAYMVPVERDIDALVESGVCDGSRVACLAGDSGLPIAIPSRYAPGTREALEQIASAGVLGKTVATMLIVDGVLEPDYHVENARLFGELDERTGLMTPSGLSVTARVERIIDRAQRLAAWAGAISGAEALVPIAGIALSIAHEEWMLFEIHVERAGEPGTGYGVVTCRNHGDSLPCCGITWPSGRVSATGPITPVMSLACVMIACPRLHDRLHDGRLSARRHRWLRRDRRRTARGPAAA